MCEVPERVSRAATGVRTARMQQEWGSYFTVVCEHVNTAKSPHRVCNWLKNNRATWQERIDS